MLERCRRAGLGRALTVCLGVALVGALPQEGEAPEVRLVNFHGGVYKGGSRHYVFWRSLGEGAAGWPVSIELSRNRGTDWEAVADGLPNKGRYLWTVPREDGDSYRLRVTLEGEEGRLISSVSSADFSIDSAAPDIRPYCKTPGEAACTLDSARAEIRFDLPLDPGPAAVTGLEVWMTTDGGITWKKVAKLRPSDRLFPLRLSPGETGIILVTQDAAGNRDDNPLGGSEPELRLHWKMEEAPPPAPVVGIEAGGTYKGGQIVTLRWNPENDYEGSSARIEIQLEGKPDWVLLKGDLRWKGSADITLPDNINSSQTRIRIYLPPVQEDDEPWVRFLGPFRLEALPPKARIKKIEEEK